jgi:hypothetical protein
LRRNSVHKRPLLNEDDNIREGLRRGWKIEGSVEAGGGRFLDKGSEEWIGMLLVPPW